MRLWRCAATLASAMLFATSVARPPPSMNGGMGTMLSSDPAAADPEANKYFHEPGQDEILGHYDIRYFHKVVDDEERTDTQSHMIRAYLTFFRENDLDTWIAHGTLLGWWWNGKRLPWDFDLDTQVSNITLQRLGDSFNQTRYQYTSPDGQVKREYLLDVNPFIWERERGDGLNIIDARWIDIRNGLYIDITGLSEVHPETSPGVWSCKNYHFYKTTELYPMRETMFEGVNAKVPYEYDKILVDEYSVNALIRTDFNGHEWDPKQKEWVKTQATLKDERVMREMRETLERIQKEDNEKRVKDKALQEAQLY